MTAANRRAATVAAVKAQHATARAIRGRRPAVRKRLPLQLEPNGVALAYFRALKQVDAIAHQLVAELVLPRLRELARRALAGGNVHDEVARLVQLARAAFARDYPHARLVQIVGPFGRRTSDFQRIQLMRQLKAGLGAEPPLRDAGAIARVQAFATENATKLAANVGAYFDQVQGKLLAALRPGVRHDAPPPPPPADGGFGEVPPEDYSLSASISVDTFVLDLGKELDRRGEVLDGRAAQLADLQVRSLFADLNEQRQAELGLSEYTWRTMGDDRVRPSHAALDGTVQRWDRPTAHGLPGDEPNCRCIAEPRLEGVADEL